MFGERSCITSVAELVEAPEVMINPLRGLAFPTGRTDRASLQFAPRYLRLLTCDLRLATCDLRQKKSLLLLRVAGIFFITLSIYRWVRASQAMRYMHYFKRALIASVSFS
jgi:hypothetical protein